MVNQICLTNMSKKYTNYPIKRLSQKSKSNSKDCHSNRIEPSDSVATFGVGGGEDANNLNHNQHHHQSNTGGD